MPYRPTSDITAGLATWLKALKYENLEPLLDHVARYDAPDLVNALNDLLTFTASRVALVVPGPERYTGALTPGVPVIRRRITTITVILALQDADRIPAAAANSESVAEVEAVIDLKDEIIARMATWHPDAVPVSGDPYEVRDSENPDARLWRAWIARFEVFAGSVEYDNDTFLS